MWTCKALHNFIALCFSIVWRTMLLTEAGAISTLLLVWGWKNSMKREKNGGNHLLGTNDVIKVSSLISFFPTCWYVIDDVGKLWNNLVVPAIYLKQNLQISISCFGSPYGPIVCFIKWRSPSRRWGFGKLIRNGSFVFVTLLALG